MGEPAFSDLHTIVSLISSVNGTVSNMQEGITNERQLPRMREDLEEALDILRNMIKKEE